MKFSITAMSAVFATVLALPSPSPAIQQNAADLKLAPPTPEVLAAFNALSKVVLPPGKAGNIAVTALDDRSLDARTNIVLYITADINWGGRNEPLESAPGVCYNLGNGWNDVVSSAGPNLGHCDLFQDAGCSGPSLINIRYPGIADLNAIGWGDRISSYRCFDS